jgi:FKBP-type peptidyl-prolyl cis-trans isomerase FkpA
MRFELELLSKLVRLHFCRLSLDRQNRRKTETQAAKNRDKPVSSIFTRGETMRLRITLIFLLTLSIALLAQTKKPTKSADKKDGPTAVTGKPTTTPSGLEYWDIKKGGGKLAEKGKKVSVHYTGWLTNGKEFDSSRDAGEPIQFDLGTGQVIKGWDEGIAGMKVGGQRQLRIPPALGYGARGFGSSIPPNSTLVFDVELMDVK